MIVAVSREFGAGALEIARLVGERCGLRLVVDELPHLAADRLGLPRDETLTDEDVAPTVLDALIAQLPGASVEAGALPDFEEVDLRDALRRRLEEALIDASATLDAVVLGRAASFALGPRRNVVRVFVHAPRAWREARLVGSFGYAEAAARAAIARIDAARERYVREFYSASWRDARGYDLTLDASRMGTAEAAELVISCVAARYHER